MSPPVSFKECLHCCPLLDFVRLRMCYLLRIMSDNLPLELLSGAKLEIQLKEGQPGMQKTIRRARRHKGVLRFRRGPT